MSRANAYLLLPLLLVAGTLAAQQEPPQTEAWTTRLKRSIHASALIETEAAWAFQQQKLQKWELIFKPELDISLSKKLRWKIRGRLYTEWTDRLEPGRPQQEAVSPFSRRLLLGDRAEAELRECFLDLKLKKAYLSLGKQQIVWGKADGLRIMDLVNPFNFREFILDEFEDSRIPLWSLKLDVPLKKINAQLIWIPDPSYHDFPAPGAPYAFALTPPTEEVLLLDPDKPKHAIRDSDLGLKLSSFLQGWDISLNYLYYYDDNPVLSQRLLQRGDQNLLALQAAYRRNHLAGTTFSNVFGKFSLRGEAAFVFGKHFQTTEAEASEGLLRSHQLMGVLGLDYSGFRNTTLSLQLFQDWATTRLSLQGRQALETYSTLLLSRHFLHETLGTEFIWVQNLKGEGFARGSVHYLLRSNLKASIGAEAIWGNKKSLLGQFSSQDRLVVGLELGI